MGRGFTLIELLIVVVIIAILASIAVAMMFEAGVRAKVARAYSDMRTLNLAIPAYRNDHNYYPPYNWDPFILSRLTVLTTPIAYIASIPQDPFLDGMPASFAGDIDWAEAYKIDGQFQYPLPYDYITKSDPTMDVSSFSIHSSVDWAVKSAGPAGIPIWFFGPLQAYDPTNGTVSAGVLIMSGPGNQIDRPGQSN